MATFIDVHHGMIGITDEQFRQAHEADVAVQDEEGVTFVNAWADPVNGIVYCLSEGPSAEAVQQVHQRTGHPADEIHEVPLQV